MIARVVPCLLFLLALIGVGSAASADTLVLANGDEIHGEIIEWAVDHVVIEHPELGTLRLELGQLKLDTGKPPTPGLFGTRFLRGWSRHIDIGANGEENNGQTGSFTLGSKFAFTNQWTRWRFNGRYFYSIADDGDTGKLDNKRDLQPIYKELDVTTFTNAEEIRDHLDTAGKAAKRGDVEEIDAALVDARSSIGYSEVDLPVNEVDRALTRAHFALQRRDTMTADAELRIAADQVRVFVGHASIDLDSGDIAAVSAGPRR